MHDSQLGHREVERITGMSRSLTYRQMQGGEFSCPVKVGSAAVRWGRSTSPPGWSSDQWRGAISEREALPRYSSNDRYPS